MPLHVHFFFRSLVVTKYIVGHCVGYQVPIQETTFGVVY